MLRWKCWGRGDGSGGGDGGDPRHTQSTCRLRLAAKSRAQRVIGIGLPRQAGGIGVDWGLESAAQPLDWDWTPASSTSPGSTPRGSASLSRPSRCCATQDRRGAPIAPVEKVGLEASRAARDETLPGAGPAWGIDAIVELLREVEEELIREVLVQRDVYRRERIVANSISSV